MGFYRYGQSSALHHIVLSPNYPMKNKLLSLLFAVFLSGSLVAQDWSSAREPGAISSVNDAAKMAKEILDALGMKANFRIAAAQVPNAMAVVHQGKRYILYNPQFVQTLTRVTGTKWAAVSVLAHEIGHHLYPSSENAGKRPLSTELEADQFSGFVLQKMGASLEDAQAAMKVLGSKYATPTHPARTDRLVSIATGWKNAGGVIDEIREDVVQQETALPSRYIAGTLKFKADPSNEYYLTTRMNVVKLEGNELKIIGKLAKSNS